MWVADFDDAKLYAYNLNTKAPRQQPGLQHAQRGWQQQPVPASGPTAPPCGRPIRRQGLFLQHAPERRRHTQRAHGRPHGHHRLRPRPDGLPGWRRVHRSPGPPSTRPPITRTPRWRTAPRTPTSPPTANRSTSRPAANAVTVTVTSQDGSATLDYTVSVNRGVAGAYGWKAALTTWTA